METGLYVGDCVDVMSKMSENCVDLTITSPPYDDLRDYNGYIFDFEAIAKQLFRVTKQGGIVVWVVADRTLNGSETGTSFRQALYFMEVGFNLHDTMIFAKPAFHRADHTRYYPAFDYMFVLSKGTPKTINLINDRKNKGLKGKVTLKRRDRGSAEEFHRSGKQYGRRRNIWEYKVGYACTKDKIAYEHPAIFPEKLAEDHILSWSNAGDLVFDPMCGSGTVGKMALKNNRKFIGIDISAEYIEIARERMQLVQSELAIGGVM